MSVFERKRGQLTLFVVLAILVVVAIVLYFFLRGNISAPELDAQLKPAYDAYLECLTETTRQGVNLLGEQGGYIETPDFVPGSLYMPSSSQLDFFGQPVQYWLYVSGNNILKESVPTLSSMRGELEDYVEARLDFCNFDEYEAAGYGVYIGDGTVSVDIRDNEVIASVRNQVNIYYADKSASVVEHEVRLNIPLGKYYTLARDIYNLEKEGMFLEKYAIDVLRNYAPVDGVDLSCEPRVFVDEKIRQNLSEGLVMNMNSIRLPGNYYESSNKNMDYFVVDSDMDVSDNVNFMYNPAWPTRIEIYGDRVAKPVGVQPGLSMLGFCYVPYHLIYDVNFPVLVQIWQDEFLFQFPMAVIIDNNQARDAIPPSYGGLSLGDEVCQGAKSDVTINTYDAELEPVPARLQFKCLDSVCEVGETVVKNGEAVFSGEVPQCVNGFIVATSEGYKDTKYQISTNSENYADIIMPKVYDVGLDLGNIEGNAVVNFLGSDYSASAVYPTTKEISLVEGLYNVTVYVYSNSSIKFPGVNDRKCVDVPLDGVGAIFGATTEKCFNVEVPAMDIESALVGGGFVQQYISESELYDSQELNINVPLYGKPKDLTELQDNMIRVETEKIYLEFE
jgi:hypothetical protein